MAEVAAAAGERGEELEQKHVHHLGARGKDTHRRRHQQQHQQPQRDWPLEGHDIGQQTQQRALGHMGKLEEHSIQEQQQQQGGYQQQAGNAGSHPSGHNKQHQQHHEHSDQQPDPRASASRHRLSELEAHQIMVAGFGRYPCPWNELLTTIRDQVQMLGGAAGAARVARTAEDNMLAALFARAYGMLQRPQSTVAEVLQEVSPERTGSWNGEVALSSISVSRQQEQQEQQQQQMEQQQAQQEQRVKQQQAQRVKQQQAQQGKRQLAEQRQVVQALEAMLRTAYSKRLVAWKAASTSDVVGTLELSAQLLPGASVSWNCSQSIAVCLRRLRPEGNDTSSSMSIITSSSSGGEGSQDGEAAVGASSSLLSLGPEAIAASLRAAARVQPCRPKDLEPAVATFADAIIASLVEPSKAAAAAATTGVGTGTDRGSQGVVTVGSWSSSDWVNVLWACCAAGRPPAELLPDASKLLLLQSQGLQELQPQQLAALAYVAAAVGQQAQHAQQQLQGSGVRPVLGGPTQQQQQGQQGMGDQTHPFGSGLQEHEQQLLAGSTQAALQLLGAAAEPAAHALADLLAISSSSNVKQVTSLLQPFAAAAVALPLEQLQPGQLRRLRKMAGAASSLAESCPTTATAEEPQLHDARQQEQQQPLRYDGGGLEGVPMAGGGLQQLANVMTGQVQQALDAQTEQHRQQLREQLHQQRQQQQQLQRQHDLVQPQEQQQQRGEIEQQPQQDGHWHHLDEQQQQQRQLKWGQQQRQEQQPQQQQQPRPAPRAPVHVVTAAKKVHMAATLAATMGKGTTAGVILGSCGEGGKSSSKATAIGITSHASMTSGEVEGVAATAVGATSTTVGVILAEAVQLLLEDQQAVQLLGPAEIVPLIRSLNVLPVSVMQPVLLRDKQQQQQQQPGVRELGFVTTRGFMNNGSSLGSTISSSSAAHGDGFVSLLAGLPGLRGVVCEALTHAVADGGVTGSSAVQLLQLITKSSMGGVRVNGWAAVSGLSGDCGSASSSPVGASSNSSNNTGDLGSTWEIPPSGVSMHGTYSSSSHGGVSMPGTCSTSSHGGVTMPGTCSSSSSSDGGFDACTSSSSKSSSKSGLATIGTAESSGNGVGSSKGCNALLEACSGEAAAAAEVSRQRLISQLLQMRPSKLSLHQVAEIADCIQLKPALKQHAGHAAVAGSEVVSAVNDVSAATAAEYEATSHALSYQEAAFARNRTHFAHDGSCFNLASAAVQRAVIGLQAWGSTIAAVPAEATAAGGVRSRGEELKERNGRMKHAGEPHDRQQGKGRAGGEGEQQEHAKQGFEGQPLSAWVVVRSLGRLQRFANSLQLPQSVRGQLAEEGLSLLAQSLAQHTQQQQQQHGRLSLHQYLVDLTSIAAASSGGLEMEQAAAVATAAIGQLPKLAPGAIARLLRALAVGIQDGGSSSSSPPPAHQHGTGREVAAATAAISTSTTCVTRVSQLEDAVMQLFAQAGDQLAADNGVLLRQLMLQEVRQLISSYALLSYKHDALLTAAGEVAATKIARALSRQQPQQQQQMPKEAVDLLLMLTDMVSLGAVTAGQHLESVAHKVLLPYAQAQWTSRQSPGPLIKLAEAAAAFSWTKQGWVGAFCDPLLPAAWEGSRGAARLDAAAPLSVGAEEQLKVPPSESADPFCDQDASNIDTQGRSDVGSATSSSSSSRDSLARWHFAKKYSGKQLWCAALATLALQEQWGLTPDTPLQLLPPWAPTAEQLLFGALRHAKHDEATGMAAAGHADVSSGEPAGIAFGAVEGADYVTGSREGLGGLADGGQLELVGHLLQLVPARHRVVPLPGAGSKAQGLSEGRVLTRESWLHGSVLVIRPQGPVLFLLPRPGVVDMVSRSRQLARSSEGGAGGRCSNSSNSSHVDSNSMSSGSSSMEQHGNLGGLTTGLDVGVSGSSDTGGGLLGCEQKLELELLREFCKKVGVQLVHLQRKS